MNRFDLDYSQILVQIGYNWIDLSDYQVGAVVCDWGMIDNSPVNRTASTGTMKFDLLNLGGRFTPGASGAMSGWGKGIPIKFVAVYFGESFTRWRGVVRDIKIKLGYGNMQRVSVLCVDWMDYAANTPLLTPSILEDKDSGAAVEEVLDLVPSAPAATSIETGIATFEAIFDVTQEQTKIYSELVKIALSEVGYIYLRKDKTNGETLVFENAYSRDGLDDITEFETPGDLLLQGGGLLLLQDGGRRLLNVSTNYTELDNSALDCAVDYGGQVLNRITCLAYPRYIDSSVVVLFALNSAITISSGQTKVIAGFYVDPDGGTRINAKDFIDPPVATTDYLMNTKADGSGTNITANLTIVDTAFGSDRWEITVKNTAAKTGYITKFNIRGKGVYIYSPIEYVESDVESVADNGYQDARFDQKYQVDLEHGRNEVSKIIEYYKTARVEIMAVSFCANVSNEMMVRFLQTDIGYMIRVLEDQLEIDSFYHVQGIKFSLERGVIMCEWILKRFYSLKLGLSLLSVEFWEGTKDAVNFGYIPTVYSNDTPYTITISAWVKLRSPVGTGPWEVVAFSTNNGGLRFYVMETQTLAIYQNIFDSYPGNWRTTSATVSAGSWVHVAATYDYSDVGNDPVFYIDGDSKAVTEIYTPAGSEYDRAGIPLVIGNQISNTEDYDAPFDGEIYDVRIFHEILSADEIDEIYTNGKGSLKNPVDPVFWGPCVRTKELEDYVGQWLTEEMKVLDNVHGIVGTPLELPMGKEVE